MRSRRRPLLAVAAAVTLAGGASAAGASSPTPPPEAVDGPTSDELVAAAERTAAAASRFEMFVDISGIPGAPALGSTDAPLASGAVSGTSAHIVIDLSSILGGLGGAGLPGELAGVDLSVETIAIGTDYYLRAPFLAAIGDLAGGASGPLAPFASIGDRWGHIDLAAIQADASDVGTLLGNSASSPAALYEVITTTSGIEPLGTEEIRGVESTGVRADVELRAVLEAQKIDEADLPGDAAGVLDATFPVEVWLGDDGFIRRLTLGLDAQSIAGAAEAAGETVPADELADLAAAGVSTTIESFDFDAAADIVIEAPAESVDITDAVGELLGTAQQTA